MSFRSASIALALVAAAYLTGCGNDLPRQGSEEYSEAVSAFYTGVAALQVGSDRHAEEQLRYVTELAPGEPAAWANLGILALRQIELDQADEYLRRAGELAPENSRIEFLLGTLEATRGNADAAIEHFERARSLDPQDIRAINALAEQLQQRGGENALDRVQALMDEILEIDPDNLAILVERARLAAAAEDLQALQATVDRLEEHQDSWGEQSQTQLDAVQDAVAAGDFEQAGMQLSFLNNVLKREPAFLESSAAVRSEPGRPDELITEFIALTPPEAQPAPPDDSLTFGVEPLFADQSDRPWNWVRAVALSGDGLPVVIGATSDALVFEDGTTIATARAGNLQADGFIPLDYTYDFRIDLALAGPGGLVVYRQNEDSTFADATAELGLDPGTISAAYRGGWSVDVDLEGDLDLILSRVDGSPTVLINQGDGTFLKGRYFDEAENVIDFTWADFDADGDPDAALVEQSGTLRLYRHGRSQGFTHTDIGSLTNAAASAAADLDNDGILELVVINTDGAISRVQLPPDPAGTAELQPIEPVQIALWEDMPAEAQQLRLYAEDFDNNGAIDLIASGAGQTAVWLSHPDGTFARVAASAAATTYSVIDVTGAGRLDLIGVAPDGSPVRLGNRGTTNYHSKTVRPMAAEAVGDQRINPFGIGGTIEVRSGPLFQKQPITSPIVHFGLGEQLVVDVARIVWPNGDIQAEFDLLSDETVQARQRLKGSCPWLFTYNGEEMVFVTDFIWRSPLGLAINAQEAAGVLMTEDWVKIEGSELVPRDGYYDVRITAELWETHFFDHVSLLVVDHPAETEVWVDERFAVPPPEMKVHVTGLRHPVRMVQDDAGRDITSFVAEKDGTYLSSFDLGQYQGVAKMHTITIDLSDAPADGPLYLLADGWVRPTDSSINVALSQGTHAPPQGLRLDVPDGTGGWTTVYDNLGFPAGKHKTILVDLTDIFPAEQRVRLTTNLEVYWDAIAWAAGSPDSEIRTTHLQPAVADLRYRGYSVVSEPERSRPEVPVYDSLMSTVQIWQDLAGYYTRFGDVRELLADIDDRYVIMNAGDEMAFQFEAVEPPQDGWVRDYVLIGDGWVKDGDFNTTYSETVRPLPAHDLPEYTMPRGALEEDEVYQRHPEDWREYHTRYVSPLDVRTAMAE